MNVNYLKYEIVPTYSDIFDCSPTNNVFISRLKTISCEKAIYILSRFESLFLAYIQNNIEAKKLYNQLRIKHSHHIQTLGGNITKYCNYKFLMCHQSVFLLEKWVMCYCPMEHKISEVTISDLMNIMDLFLLVNERLPKEDVAHHETEYLYLMLFYNSNKIIKNQMARAYYIFTKVARRDKNIVDFLNEYKKRKGFSIEERIAVLFNSLGSINVANYTIEGMFTNGGVVCADNFDCKRLSHVYTKVMREIRKDYSYMCPKINNILSQEWNFEPFYRFPFLKIDDWQFCFSETFLVYQMWEGLYWDVRYTFPNDGEIFMTQFGKPFEAYVQEITRAAAEAANNQVVFQNEFFYYYNRNKIASTDCYFRIGNTLFAVEVKAKSPSSTTLTGVNRVAIEAEVNDLIIDPIEQAVNRLNEINSCIDSIDKNIMTIFNNLEEVIVLSVTMEKVQPIGELLFVLDKKLKSKLSNTKIVAYHNVNIEEYENLCNLIETQADKLPNLLTDWFKCQRKDKRSGVVLANYLIGCNLPYTCSNYVETLFNYTINDIYCKTFCAENTIDN